MKLAMEDFYPDVEVLPTYLKFNGGEFPAGKVIFDKRRGMALRNVSDNFSLIKNEDVLRQVKSKGNINIKDRYITPSGTEFYLIGTYPHESLGSTPNGNYIIGFEMGNSYSSRFMPYVNLAIYNVVKDHFILTDQPMYEFKRKGGITSHVINKNIHNLIFYNKDIPAYYLFDIIKSAGNLPSALNFSFDEFKAEMPINNTVEVTLNYVASVAKVWKESAFEHAIRWQRISYKMIKEEIKNGR